MSNKRYTVHLYRSGRVRVTTDPHNVSRDVDPPILTEQIEAASEVAALGKLLLKYVDRANQPCTLAHLTDVPDGPVLTRCVDPGLCAELGPTCPYCVWAAEPCMCGLSRSSHTPSMSPAHSFMALP